MLPLVCNWTQNGFLAFGVLWQISLTCWYALHLYAPLMYAARFWLPKETLSGPTGSMCMEQVMFVLFSVAACLWGLLLWRKKTDVHRIHHLMTVLVAFKAATLLSQARHVTLRCHLTLCIFISWQRSLPYTVKIAFYASKATLIKKMMNDINDIMR